MPPPTKPNLKLDPSFLFDALIIGAGPAGLSAALTMSRVRATSVVFSDANFRNAKGRHAHYTLSRDHQPAPEVRRIGREEIERYGTTRFVDRGVVKAKKDDAAGAFEVEDESGESWRGKKVLLATGSKDILETGIEGYEDCWGTSIHQCLFCDGIEMNDKPVGVLGFDVPPIAVHNIGLILQMGCPSVTIYANGKLEPADDNGKQYVETAKAMSAKVDEREIAKLVELGEREGMKIVFKDGSEAVVGFLAHKPITRPNARHLAEQLGVEVIPDGWGGEMLQRSEPFGASNVDGVFVAGDAGVVMKAWVGAMGQGVAAGAWIASGLAMEKEQNAVAHGKGKAGELDPR